MAIKRITSDFLEDGFRARDEAKAQQESRQLLKEYAPVPSTPVPAGNKRPTLDVGDLIDRGVFESAVPKAPENPLARDLVTSAYPRPTTVSPLLTAMKNYSRAKPSASVMSSPAIKEAAPVRPPSSLDAFKAGIANVTRLAGGAAKWLGAEETGQKWVEAGTKVGNYYGGNLPQGEGLTDPNTWKYDVVRALPSTLTLLPLSAAGALVGSGAAGLAGLGTVGTGLATFGGGALASRAAESLFEAGDAYQSALDRGMTENDASKAAGSVYVKNLGLTGMDAIELVAAFGRVPGAGKLAHVLSKAGRPGQVALGAGRIGATGLMEGAEEGIQQTFQGQALGEDTRGTIQQILNPNPEVAKSMQVGAAMGLGFGGIGAVHGVIGSQGQTQAPVTPDQRWQDIVNAFKVPQGQPVQPAAQPSPVSPFSTGMQDFNINNISSPETAVRDFTGRTKWTIPQGYLNAPPRSGGKVTTLPITQPRFVRSGAVNLSGQVAAPPVTTTVPTTKPIAPAAVPPVQQTTTQPRAGFTVGEKVEWIDLQGNARPGTVFSVDGENITVATDKGGRVPLKPDRVRKIGQQAVPAAEPVSLSLPEVTSNKQKVVDLTGMGSGIADSMYDMLWDKLQKGDTTEAGQPSAYLQAGKILYDSGHIKNKEDMKKVFQRVVAIKDQYTGDEYQQALKNLITEIQGTKPAERPVSSSLPVEQKQEAGTQSKLQPDIVFREIRDFNGKVLGIESEKYDGTKEGARKAAEAIESRLDEKYPDWSNINSRIGATDKDGNPKYTVSPNLQNVKDVQSETDEARYIWGDIEALESTVQPEPTTAPTVGESSSTGTTTPTTEGSTPQAGTGEAAGETAGATLKDYGLSLRKKTTKNNNTAWEVQGDTYQYKGNMGRSGGRHYKPHPKAKGTWTFYGDQDPTERILKNLPTLEKKPETPPAVQEEPPVQPKEKPRENPRTKAVGVITGEKVNRLEERGYEIVYGEKPSGEAYWDIVGILSGRYADRLFEAGLTVKRKEKPAGAESAQKEGKPQAGASKTQEPVVESKQRAPYLSIADFVFLKLKSGVKFTSDQLFKVADEAYGGTQAQGKYTSKDAYDAMELGFNQYLLEQKSIDPGTSNIERAQATVEILNQSLKNIPTQTKRTAEQEEWQQFSTPPNIAYTAAWAANINKNDVVLEPSAGVGGLAVFGKLAGAEVIVNELSPRRAALLRELNFDQVFTENAEQLNNILPDDVKPTVVIMNPPFSSTAGRMQGARKTKFAEAHLEQALKRLEPGGRLVAIVGRGMSDDAGTFRDWWKGIKKEYNVRANIGIDGKNYAKYGTTFDVQILVIDKTGATPEGGTVTGSVTKLEDAISLLEVVRNDRAVPTDKSVKQAASKSDGKGLSEKGQSEARPGPAVSSATGGVGSGERKSESAGPEGNISGPVGTGQKPTASGQSRGDNEPTDQRGAGPGSSTGNVGKSKGTGKSEESGGRSGIPAGQDKDGRGGEGGGAVSEAEEIRSGDNDTGGTKRSLGLESEIAVESEETRHTGEELSDAVFAAYTPQRLKIPGAKEHPDNLAQSAAMAAVEPPVPTYTPNLPKEIIIKGKLSIAQLESVVYAGQAHKQVLPNGQRRGFFIGDGTGVGKGREISGIILDNFRQGRKKGVWISKNDPLLEDARRDFGDLGGDPKAIFGKPKTGESIKQKEGILFMSYDTLGQGLEMTREGEAINHEGSTSRIDQIVNWLGKDFDGVIAFDEAHGMQNSLAQKGKRGVKKPSRRALAGVELQKKLPNARIVYVSATGATEVYNLAYADRLGLWGEGTPFADKKDFINKISAGGLAAMELVARDMKAMGGYIARNLGFEGVTYSTMEHRLTPEQTEIYDTMAKGWQVVLQNIYKAMEETGQVQNGNDKGRALAKFWGAQQRFFNQVLTSMQMPAVITQVKEDLKEGKAIVMQLVNTNEAIQNRAIARQEEGESLDDIDLTPRDMLMQYLDKSFPTQQYETYTDDDGNERSRPVYDSHGKPVQNREALAMKESLMSRLGAMKVPEGPLEIVLNTFGVDNVAEVTGRTRRIVRAKDEETGRMKAKRENRTVRHTQADTAAFMEDKKQILVFSEAGGTGRSYHADLTKKNQRPRKHYLIQAGWKADSAVQGFGRTHRTNQASAPEYVLVTTDLKGQKRFISSIARRLDQLGALTKGQRQTGGQGLFSAKDNLESEMARDALLRFYEDLTRNQIPGLDGKEILNKMGLAKLTDDNVSLKETPEGRDITKFLNRLLSLESGLQNKVFDAFSTRLDIMVDMAIANGTLDVGLENFKADKVRVTEEKTVYTDDKSGAETKYIALEAGHKNKPLTFEKAGKMRNFRGFYQNKRSGRVYAVRHKGTTTLESGRVVDVYYLYGQAEANVNTVTSEQFNKEKYTELPAEDARVMWQEAIDKLPEFRTEKVHLISGAILPIWDRLPHERARVIRVLTDDGRMLLGRQIGERAIDLTLKRLNASRQRQEISPSHLVDKILKDNYTVYLANEWRLVSRRVSGESRIEILGDDLHRHMDQLQKEGVFSERINWNTRFFIPTGENAAEVIGNVTKYRPVVDMEAPPKGSSGGSSGGGSSLDEVHEEMNRKIDDEIGDVNPPAGFSIKIVGKQDKDIKTEFIHTPQKTSLNQVAIGLRKAITQKVFNKGMTVIDVGGGAYDKGVEFLGNHDIKSFVYDPYARSKEHNDNVLKKVKDSGGVDAAALNNVLNVIPTDKERANVLQFMYQFLKPGGKAVITVYEGNGTGVSSRLIFNDGTSTWQENRKLADYEKEISKALPKAEITKKMGMYVVTKPTESLDEIQSDLKHKVDKKIGKVIPPMGFHIQWVEDSERLSVERGKYSFEDPEVEERFQAANGMPEESFYDKVKAAFRSLYNKAHREYEHLPRSAEFAELRKDLLKLAKQRGVAGDKTLRLQQGITINLDPYKFDVFRRYVILADLMEEAEAGHNLPFGFTEDTLQTEWDRINKETDKHPEIREAIVDRQKIWKAIVREYTRNMRSIGFNVDKRFSKESYYRHQVIEYAKLKGRATYGTGQKLKTPTGRGFLKQRGGSEMDINTNYLQAEYEVMAQMLYDVEVARTIKAVDDNYNIQKRLKQEAKAHNQRAIDKIAARQDEIGQLVQEALKSFKIKLGMSFGRIRKHAETGELWAGDNDEYQDIVDQLRDGYGSDMDDDRNRMFKYLSELLVREDVGSMEAATILKAVGQRREFIKQTLGKNYKTWEDMIPDGYVAWQPREGNVFFMSETIPGHLAEKLFTDQIEQLGISKDDLNRALTIGGRRKEFVIKEEIAATLDNLTKPAADDLLHKVMSEPLRAWKVWQLLSPRRWFKYNFRNISGDAEAVFIGNPRAFAKLPRAAKELYEVFAGDKSMTADMQGWFERGGMQTLLQVQELGEINNLRMFLKLQEKKDSAAKIPIKAWQGYWKAVRLSTDYREALLRYASYLSYLEQMEKNGGQPKNFGASIPEEVMALKDNKDRAFKLQNELLGAYDEISVIGQGLRKYLMPFWSWNEVNFRRTIQLMKNAARDEKLAYAVGRKLIGTVAIRTPFLAMKVGKFAITAFAMWTILTLWNNWRFPEEEKELPENVKSRPHIIFGRDADGKILYFDRLGFVQDFLSWFGLDEAPLTAKELINGKMTLKEFATEAAKAPVNKLWQSIGPHIKLPVEEALGSKTFPDVFKPGRIRDRWQYLAESFGLGNEYKQLAGKPVPTIEGSRGRGYVGSLRDVFTYSADPGQSAYYDILDEKYKYMKKLNKPEGYSTSPRSEALYNFKLSLRYKDKEAARKYLLEYAMLGGTDKGLAQSLKTMDPLYGLNDEEKIAFVVSLNTEDRQKLVRALQYYQTVLLGK